MNRSRLYQMGRQRGDAIVRRGVSLVELLVVITMLAALLTCTSVTLIRLLRAQSSGGQALAEALTISRLARDLRRDAHAAVTAELAGPAESRKLTLTTAAGAGTTYALGGDGVMRVGPAADGAALHEEYRLGSAQCALQLKSEGRLVQLTVRQMRSSDQTRSARSSLPTALPEELTIEAAVGGTRVAGLERVAP